MYLFHPWPFPPSTSTSHSITLDANYPISKISDAKTLVSKDNLFPSYSASSRRIFHLYAKSIDPTSFSQSLNMLHSYFFSFFSAQVVMNFIIITLLQTASTFPSSSVAFTDKNSDSG